MIMENALSNEAANPNSENDIRSRTRKKYKRNRIDGSLDEQSAQGNTGDQVEMNASKQPSYKDMLAGATQRRVKTLHGMIGQTWMMMMQCFLMSPSLMMRILGMRHCLGCPFRRKKKK